MEPKTFLKKRALIRLISYIVAITVVLLVFAISNHTKSERYRVQVEMGYQRALNELSEYISAIDTALSKGAYANTSSMLGQITSTLVKSTSGAKMSLSALPISDLELDNTYKFFSQLGDYSLYLNKKLASGQKLTQQEHESLVGFTTLLSGISQEVDFARQNISSAGYFTGNAENNLLKSNETLESFGFSDSLKSAETSMEEFPTLIYDGPFSDHIMQLTAKALENKEEISQEQATELAIKYGFDNPQFVGMENSTIEQYCFSDENAYMGISKKGGFLCYMIKSAEVTQESISPEDAIDYAVRYLQNLGINNMKESYYAKTEGQCTINFAYTENGITYYPDLIKVTVALDTGEIVGVDARGYLTNHHVRNGLLVTLTQEEAMKNVSHNLTVIDSKLCVIPSSGKNEFFCYEFHCTDVNSKEYLVYIDTQTGQEDNILLLLYSDDGTLTK
ncbi:MAG: germination protein YpeB [Clostridia bacterium]|nr:germination protein YpeB [Clostridia bacterium]